MKILHKITTIALAIFLLGAAIKLRFLWDDLFVYYLSFGVFAVAAVIGSALHIQYVGPRITASAVFGLLLAGPVYAFYLTGGVETTLMSTILLYTAVGILIVLYPWSEDSLNSLLQALAIGGSIISLHTMFFFGTDDALIDLQSEEIATDYLTASFAMGLGVICATYFLVKNFSPFSIAIFAVNWLGIALGRGRGAFIFCVLVCILYLIIALNTRIARFSRKKKTLMIILIASFIPIVFMQIQKIGRMREGLARIFFSPDLEADVGGRGSAFSQGMEVVMRDPVFGNGLGAYAENEFLHPHNLIISWAADSGLIGVSFLALYFLFIAGMFFRSISLSTDKNINIVYALGALCAYMFLNYMKSNDPYQSRELYTLSALPIAAYLVVSKEHWRARRRGRRRRNAQRSSHASHRHKALSQN